MSFGFPDRLGGGFKIPLKRETLFLIWSIEHGAWWKPRENGYTALRAEAGKYSLKDALRIVRSANIGLHDEPNEAMIEYVEA